MNIKSLKSIALNSKTSLLVLWIAYFLFSLCAGFIFYNFLIPNLSSLHAIGSTLTPDSTYFNNVAIKLVKAIREHGWSEWKLYPATGAAGQSSFLAILYFYFGVNPLFAIPLNALFHSLSAILIYLITIELLKGYKYSPYVALVNSLCYLAFPIALILVSQIHKDIYVSFGFLLALWAILKVLLFQGRNIGLLRFFFISIFALIMIAIMKPYLLQVLAVNLMLIIIFQLVRIFPFSFIKMSFLVAYLVIIVCVFLQIINLNTANSGWFAGESYISTSLTWKKSDFLPEVIDRKFRAIAACRLSLISSGLKSNSKSMIDVEEKPASTTEVLIYVPRAFQVALLAPFPDRWFHETSLVKTISSLEMLIFYIAFLGLVFLIGKQFQYLFLLCFIFAAVPLIMFGVSSPNIGTLYRIRYPFEMILMMLGICGWSLFHRQYVKQTKYKAISRPFTES